MSAFIEVHTSAGEPVSLNVDHIVDVCPQHGEEGGNEYHSGITTANQDAVNIWPVREHYPAVMALIARAGAKVVR